MMNQRKRSILFLLFTAGLFAGVLFCTETTQAKVKTTIKNGVCTVSGKGAMTDDTSYNKKIKKVIIKDGVTSLPEEAFAGCLKLKEISIADSVKSIGACAEQGFITPKDGTVLLKYVGKDDNVCIPQGITKIEKNAFASSTLKNVVFPEGLEKIGENAFVNCKKLTKVTIPKSVDIIDQDAFSKCKNLKKITFKGTPSDISPYAFDGTAVVSEPGSIKTQYTWAVLDRLKSTRKKSVFNGTFHCLRLKSADGYELQISSTKKFTKKTTKTFAVKKDGKRVCRNLKLPNDLYLRIRPYKLTGSEKTYGKWTYADYDTWGYADET